MRTIDASQVKQEINRCYMDYDPGYPHKFGHEELMSSFKYYLERTAGIRLEFEVEMIERTGRLGYGMRRVEIVDDKKFTMFLMKYSS